MWKAKFPSLKSLEMRMGGNGDSKIEVVVPLSFKPKECEN